MFDGTMLIWDYPQETQNGDQFDLVEGMELDGQEIRRHRTYWALRGTERIIVNANAEATECAACNAVKGLVGPIGSQAQRAPPSSEF
ncbi:hypothetical protein ABIB25_000173 [Nakamurella sp. UYEF19]|uniref:hypothetical protein n=1 Tax=Nakamurella sp. UYEF19 TaxID=1756392 RepID=UPI003397A1E2